MLKNKDCTACVYETVCEGRKEDTSIRDCCIPEAPLRKIQQSAMRMSLSAYITETIKYITEYKKESKYWSSYK